MVLEHLIQFIQFSNIAYTLFLTLGCKTNFCDTDLLIDCVLISENSLCLDLNSVDLSSINFWSMCLAKIYIFKQKLSNC